MNLYRISQTVKAGRRFVGGDLGARESDSRKWAEIARERAEAACVKI